MENFINLSKTNYKIIVVKLTCYNMTWATALFNYFNHKKLDLCQSIFTISEVIRWAAILTFTTILLGQVVNHARITQIGYDLPQIFLSVIPRKPVLPYAKSVTKRTHIRYCFGDLLSLLIRFFFNKNWF